MSLLLLLTTPPILAMMFVSDATGFLLCRMGIGIGLASFVSCQAWVSVMFSKPIVGLANATAGGDGAGSRSGEIVTLVKLLKTPKLLRVGRMFKFLERIEGAANVGRIFLLVMLMGFVVHVISCIWYAVAATDGGYLDAEGLRALAWYDQYLANFYTSLMMVMGDSTGPITKGETWFASTIVLIGATMNATIFATVASYVAQIGATNAQHKARIESIVRATRLLKVGALRGGPPWPPVASRDLPWPPVASRALVCALACDLACDPACGRDATA